jgi:hypothetical protein
MIDQTQYRNIVRASAWCDLVVTIGFATPWSLPQCMRACCG